MAENLIRHPIGNFFIKRALQIRLIIKIMFTVVFASVICSGTLLIMYYLKFKSIILYQMDAAANLNKSDIISILLPSLLISALVNILVGFGVGLYASRKYAVPIYKLEHWAQLLMQGKLGVEIQFREREELKELTDHCNTLTRSLRETILNIKEKVDQIEVTPQNSAALEEMKKVLHPLHAESAPIHIHTKMLHRPTIDELTERNSA